MLIKSYDTVLYLTDFGGIQIRPRTQRHIFETSSLRGRNYHVLGYAPAINNK